jgi:hypothetical protein
MQKRPAMPTRTPVGSARFLRVIGVPDWIARPADRIVDEVEG